MISNISAFAQSREYGKGVIHMVQGKVEICGVNTSKLPVVKSTQQDQFFERIKQGDEQARQEYIEGNLRLVLSVIKRFAGSNENVDDLFQIGCIGLIKAIDNFDSTLGVKFSTYAVPMIIGEIRRFLRDKFRRGSFEGRAECPPAPPADHRRRFARWGNGRCRCPAHPPPYSQSLFL